MLKGLLKQPQLLAWLLEVRASYRAAAGLAALPAVLKAPAAKPAAGAQVWCDTLSGCQSRTWRLSRRRLLACCLAQCWCAQRAVLTQSGLPAQQSALIALICH